MAYIDDAVYFPLNCCHDKYRRMPGITTLCAWGSSEATGNARMISNHCVVILLGES